jgi:hypothetical protein
MAVGNKIAFLRLFLCDLTGIFTQIIVDIMNFYVLQ